MLTGMKIETARRLTFAFLFAFLFAQTMDVAIADSEHPQAKEAHAALNIDLDKEIEFSDDIHGGCHNFHHLSFTVEPLSSEFYASAEFTPNSLHNPFETSLAPPVPPPLA